MSVIFSYSQAEFPVIFAHASMMEVIVGSEGIGLCAIGGFARHSIGHDEPNLSQRTIARKEEGYQGEVRNRIRTVGGCATVFEGCGPSASSGFF